MELDCNMDISTNMDSKETVRNKPGYCVSLTLRELILLCERKDVAPRTRIVNLRFTDESEAREILGDLFPRIPKLGF